jgi:hypothetical protein
MIAGHVGFLLYQSRVRWLGCETKALRQLRRTEEHDAAQKGEEPVYTSVCGLFR